MTRMRVRNIWMVSREYGELAGAGGVKDVAQQLAETLARWSGRKVRVVLPRYGFIQPREEGFAPLMDPHNDERPLQFDVDMNYPMQDRRETCRVWTRRINRVEVYLVEADRFIEKKGVYTYTAEDHGPDAWRRRGMGHYDYFAMNVLLQKSALELMVLLAEKPDVIHCHDGHTALVPALINCGYGWRSYFRQTGCLVTVHNGGVGYHQEVADLPFAHAITGLPWQEITTSRLDGKFDPFLSAGNYAILNTVSENYARELQYTDDDRLTDWLGHTLFKRGVVLEGVTNGISPSRFNPADPETSGIAASFDPADPNDGLEGKKACKKELLRMLASGQTTVLGAQQFGTVAEQEQMVLFTFIGRLSEQKGVDILLAAMRGFLRRHQNAQLVMLGSGTELLEAGVRSLIDGSDLGARVCFLRGYSPKLANIIYAAGDFFVIPSRYEPCGLTDFIAQLFGNIPVVHQVGGLVKVMDGATGLGYQGATPKRLRKSLERAMELYGDPAALREMQYQAVQRITQQYTWQVVMHKYLQLYQRAQREKLAKRLKTEEGTRSSTSTGESR